MTRRSTSRARGRDSRTPEVVGQLLGYLLIAILSAAVLTGAAAARSTPAPTGLKTAVVNGARIAYRELNPRAKGTPLVLITGYGSTMAEWDPLLLSQLAGHRRLILFDNRGIGNSAGSVRDLTIRLMANDTTGVIRALKLRRVDLLGWSMGGFIAQQVALDSPRLVRRLILASTDPGSRRTRPGRPAVIKLLTNPQTTPSELLPILFPPDQQGAANRWFQAILSQPAVTATDFAAPSATLAAQKIATTTGWLAHGKGTYSLLPTLRVPTLVAYGTRDAIVPPANAQLLLRSIPHSVALRVPDAGHAFLFQNPRQTAAAFDRFLDR